MVNEEGWKDDFVNIRTWEIHEELARHGYSSEDISNLSLDCWLVAGLVQKIIRRHRLEWMEQNDKAEGKKEKNQ